MMPGLLPGDHVLVLRFWPRQWLRRGQVVIISYPDHGQMCYQDTLVKPKYIKRITGLPGDTMRVAIPSFFPSFPDVFSQQPEPRTWHIPSEHYFVQGDSWGLDSNIVGPIPFHALYGVVITKLKRQEPGSKHIAP